MGSFVYELDGSKERHIVLVGGGSGITPLISMIKTALTQEPATKISLLYVNKNRQTTIFHKDLEMLRVEYLVRFRIYHYWGDENQKEEPGFLTGLFREKDAHPHRIGIERSLPDLSEIYPSCP
jgi:ring-1,2-phenylacetyl-CoA epoxidase subunit PaaE